MKKSMLCLSLALLFPASVVHAGEVIYRETESGIYVELSGEWEKLIPDAPSGGGAPAAPVPAPVRHAAEPVRHAPQQAPVSPTPTYAEESSTPPPSVTAHNEEDARKARFSRRQEARRKARAMQSEEEE